MKRERERNRKEPEKGILLLLVFSYLGSATVNSFQKDPIENWQVHESLLIREASKSYTLLGGVIFSVLGRRELKGRRRERIEMMQGVAGRQARKENLALAADSATDSILFPPLLIPIIHCLFHPPFRIKPRLRRQHHTFKGTLFGTILTSSHHAPYQSFPLLIPSRATSLHSLHCSSAVSNLFKSPRVHQFEIVTILLIRSFVPVTTNQVTYWRQSSRGLILN